MQSNTEKPIKVILADDDPEDQELFHDAVEKTGVATELTIVDNGQELVQHLQESDDKPDLVFADINMPVKNGKQALHEIKKDDTLKDIPVIMLSTSDNHKDVQESFNAGAQMYIQKPSNYLRFIAILKRIFSFHYAARYLGQLWKRLFISEKHPEGKEM